MDDVRVVRSDEQALILSTEDGREFRLMIDDAVASEIRQIARRDRRPSTARPRDIQMHLRSGKSRAEVARLMELEEADVERFEEPVLAERRFVLENAHRVPVRTEGSEGNESVFGEAVAQRLDSLGATAVVWRSWKEDRDPWRVGLSFTTPDTEHDAIWEFDHRKHTLRPTNTDAINLSKQGDVGAQLIPKLRAVDDGPPAPPSDDTVLEAASDPADALPATTDSITTASEYERIREIEQRAVKTVDEERADLSQTADLLDALRRRRGDRDQGDRDHLEDVPQDATVSASSSEPHQPETELPVELPEAPPSPRPAPNIWSGKGVSSESERTPTPPQHNEPPHGSETPHVPAPSDVPETPQNRRAEKSKKSRSAIPSWDDILFGTRSEEDPL